MSEETPNEHPLVYRLADEHIAEFQRLYKEHFGIELTKAQALDKGLRLIRLIEVVSRVIAADTENARDGQMHCC